MHIICRSRYILPHGSLRRVEHAVEDNLRGRHLGHAAPWPISLSLSLSPSLSIYIYIHIYIYT